MGFSVGTGSTGDQLITMVHIDVRLWPRLVFNGEVALWPSVVPIQRHLFVELSRHAELRADNLRLHEQSTFSQLKHRDLLLKRIVRRVNGKMGIPGQYLPFLRLLLQTEGYSAKNAAWLKGLLKRKGSNRIHDDVVRSFIEREYGRLTA